MTSFELSRTVLIDAPPETIAEQIVDFRQWVAWSPWEGVDADLRRTYTGPESGVGSHYAWEGAKTGAGSMEIVEAESLRTVVDLRFIKPFKATNTVIFDLVPQGSSTQVTWTMTGQRNPVMAALGKLHFDKAIGKDFDRGLAQLKAVAEAS